VSGQLQKTGSLPMGKVNSVVGWVSYSDSMNIFQKRKPPMLSLATEEAPTNFSVSGLIKM